MNPTNELILVNKPKGITSFDVIRVLRKILKVKKMGHAGTLDPNATGLMLIGVGGGTKNLANLILNDKAYKATILLGTKTDSGDIDGKITEQKDLSSLDLSQNQAQNIVLKLLGENEYTVSNYSAIKIDGKKLYELARAGIEIEPVKRTMQVYKITDILYTHPYIYATFYVAKGTYIRSLAEKIGELLNIPTTLYDLQRISIGEYKLEDAISLPDEEVQRIREIKSNNAK